jgi:hypothetical protein
MRVRAAAFELLDAVDAEPGPFGQRFLGELGAQAVLSEQICK